VNTDAQDQDSYPEPPEWIYPGARVIVERGGRLANGTVTKLTRTLVTLEDGDRFRLATLTRAGSSGLWDQVDRLLNPAEDDVRSRVRAQNAARRRARTATEVIALMTEWRADGDPGKAKAALELLHSAVTT